MEDNMEISPSDLPSLQMLAFRAIRAGRQFAKEWRANAPDVGETEGAQIAETLTRLDDREILAIQDETVWPVFENLLVEALNDCQEGYGDYALREDTRYDQLVRADQERLRRLMESWKAFRDARQLLLDRRWAAAIAGKLGG